MPGTIILYMPGLLVLPCSACPSKVVYKLHIVHLAVQIASLLFTRCCVIDENQPHCSSYHTASLNINFTSVINSAFSHV